MPLSPEDEARFRRAFASFDTDNDGKLDRNGIRRLMLEFFGRNSCSEADIDDTLSKVDTDHDGLMSLEEFITFLGSNH